MSLSQEEIIMRELDNVLVQPTVNDLWRLGEYLQTKVPELQALRPEQMHDRLLNQFIILMQKYRVGNRENSK